MILLLSQDEQFVFINIYYIYIYIYQIIILFLKNLIFKKKYIFDINFIKAEGVIHSPGPYITFEIQLP